MEFSMNIKEVTSAMQREVIKSLRKEIEEQEKTIEALHVLIAKLNEQIAEKENANRIIKNKLYDAEAIIVCNRLVYPEGVKAEPRQEQRKSSKCSKIFFVPAKV